MEFLQFCLSHTQHASAGLCISLIIADVCSFAAAATATALQGTYMHITFDEGCEMSCWQDATVLSTSKVSKLSKKTALQLHYQTRLNICYNTMAG